MNDYGDGLMTAFQNLMLLMGNLISNCLYYHCLSWYRL